MPATTYQCGSNADCPYVVDDGPQGEYYVGQFTCQGGTCSGWDGSPGSGSGQLGDVCSGDYDCDVRLGCQCRGSLDRVSRDRRQAPQ
jgi:hypothetical protein